MQHMQVNVNATLPGTSPMTGGGGAMPSLAMPLPSLGSTNASTAQTTAAKEPTRVGGSGGGGDQ